MKCIFRAGLIAVALLANASELNAAAVILAPPVAAWPELNLTGKQRVRDFWRQQDFEVFEKKFEFMAALHGMVFAGILSTENS